MEAPDERISTLRELLRRAESHSAGEARADYRRKPQTGVDAPLQNAAATAADVQQTGFAGDDWSGTLDMVLRASEKLVASEERARDLEAEVRELAESTSQEIQQLRAQVADLQRQLSEAYAGRQHAEEWLRRLTEAVHERFDFKAAQDWEARAAAS